MMMLQCSSSTSSSLVVSCNISQPTFHPSIYVCFSCLVVSASRRFSLTNSLPSLSLSISVRYASREPFTSLLSRISLSRHLYNSFRSLLFLPPASPSFARPPLFYLLFIQYIHIIIWCWSLLCAWSMVKWMMKQMMMKPLRLPRQILS